MFCTPSSVCKAPSNFKVSFHSRRCIKLSFLHYITLHYIALQLTDFEDIQMAENPTVEERQRQPSMFAKTSFFNSKIDNGGQVAAADIVDADAGFNTTIELDDSETKKQLAG